MIVAVAPLTVGILTLYEANTTSSFVTFNFFNFLCNLVLQHISRSLEAIRPHLLLFTRT
jgi:hypothetical protein